MVDGMSVVVNVLLSLMCVVNKQFELPEFVYDSVFVDLQYDISLTFAAGYVCLFGVVVLW